MYKMDNLLDVSQFRVKYWSFHDFSILYIDMWSKSGQVKWSRYGYIERAPKELIHVLALGTHKVRKIHDTLEKNISHTLTTPKKYLTMIIRRPRQTQGGARQGIILLTLVSDYRSSSSSSSCLRPSLLWCFPVRDSRFCSSQQAASTIYSLYIV